MISFWKRAPLILTVSTVCIGCDQATKALAANYLPRQQMHSYAYDLLRLGYTENLGAFLGLGHQLPEAYRFYLLTVVVGIILLGLFIYLLFSRSLNHWGVISLSLMFAGGGSNFFDRAVNSGAVVDFINVGLGPLRTGVFNLADMAILLGCFLFVLSQRE